MSALGLNAEFPGRTRARRAVYGRRDAAAQGYLRAPRPRPWHRTYTAEALLRGCAEQPLCSLQTSQLPKDDRYSVSLKEYLAEIDVCMGGRVAEELGACREYRNVFIDNY